MPASAKQQTGFTIVELLIVIVVIGILAAITIVAYNGIQTRAIKAGAQNDLTSFSKIIEVAKIDSADGKYPTVPTAAMGIKATKSSYLTNRNNWYYCVSADNSSYALGVALVGSTGGIIASSINGIQDATVVDDARTCQVVGKASGSNMGFNGTTGVWTSWVN